jgi:hypothetical protein
MTSDGAMPKRELGAHGEHQVQVAGSDHHEVRPGYRARLEQPVATSGSVAAVRTASMIG